MSKSDQKRFSRRGFCKTAVAMPVLLPGINSLDEQPQGMTEGRPSAPNQSGAESDLTDSPPHSSRTKSSIAPVSSAIHCRFKVHLKSGRIIDIVGEADDPVQAGGLCVKGPMMTQLVYNRHRLSRPLKRVAEKKARPTRSSSRSPGTRP